MYLEFRDFAILDKEKELLNINRIRVYYNFRKLISGDIVHSLKEIRIVKSTLEFDESVDKDLWDQFSTLMKNRKKNIKLPDLKITGKNLKISIKSGDNSIDVSSFFFLLNHKDKKTVFSSKGNVHLYSLKLKPNNLQTKMLITGTLKDNLEISNTVLVLNSINTKYFNMDKLAVNVSYKDDQFQLLKVDDDQPLDLKLNYLVKDKTLKVKFNSEEFILNKYITEKNIDPAVSQWLDTSISGSGGINYILTDRDLSYSADINIKTNNKKLPVQALISTKLSGDKNKISFSSLNINTIDGAIFFKGNVDYGNWLPTGKIVVSYGLPFIGIKSNFVIKSTNNKIHLESSNLSLNNVTFKNFNTDVSLFSKDLDFRSALSLSENNQHEDGLIQVNGNLQFLPDLFLNLSIKTKQIPLIIVLNSIPKEFRSYVDIIPELDLNTEAFIATDFTQFSFSAPEVDINSILNNKISFSASGNNESLNVDNINAQINKRNLSGSVKVNKSKQSITSAINLSYAGVPYTLNLEYLPERALFFDGMYGLNGSVYNNNGISNFNFEVSRFPFVFTDNTSNLSLNISGLFNNYKDWQANINNLTLENAPGFISENLLNIKGSLSNSKISLRNIKYSDPISTLLGSADFNYNLTNKREINGSLDLKSIDGESYNGEISLKDNNILMTAGFLNAALNRIQKIPVSGFVDGNFSLEGELPMPKIKMSVQLNKGEYKSSPLELETALELTDKEILLNYMRLKYRNQVFQKGSGEYNFKNGEILINSEYSGTIKDKNIKSSIEINGNTEIEDHKFSLHDLLDNNYSANISVTDILINNKASDSWNLKIDNNNNNITFLGGPSGSISGIIKNKETFNITLKTGLPVRGHATGSIRSKKLDIKLNNIEVDLALINYIPMGGFFEFESGTAYGDLRISGETDAPLFNGKLQAIAAKANVRMVPDEIKPFNTDIIFKDKELTIGPEVLYTFNASTKIGFSMLFNKWSIANYELDINSIGDQGIHIIYNVPSIGFGMDGYITRKFILKGDDTGIHINSDLLVDNCIITLGPVQESTSIINIPLFLDMKFTSGKKVQFLWPSETLPILRATANQGQDIKFIMDSLSDTYSIIGDIDIKYGSIYYFQKSFYLSEGTIGFNENESKFDPLLGFRAQIKEVDSSGEIVNITLIQDKLPISKFSPRFKSDPPLSDVEIFSILGSGVFATIGNEQIDLTSALILTGDLVAQFGIIQSFENKVEDVFKLDLFSIRTQVIQNILIDRFVDNSTIDNGVYLDSFGRYLDNTNLYLGKYFGNDIFLQGQLQISNQKVLDSGLLYASNKLFFESTISLEWKTPLFLLGFSIKPDFVDPVASIQNTSLALSWGYSY